MKKYNKEVTFIMDTNLKRKLKINRKIKFFCILLIIGICCFTASAMVYAETVKHTVVKGESMWKIAVKYKVGLSEIIAANDQIKNPALIYPGQVLNIPLVDTSVVSFEQEVIRLTNIERAKAGLPELKANWELCRVARIKSQEMSDKKYFSHQSPSYGSPFDMIKKFGISYKTAGENIAMGQRTPQAVVTAWMNSEGHRKNILNASFKEIGVGYVSSGNYWTQMFIG